MSNSTENQTSVSDYLIVGQGLAGTLLGWFLLKKGNTIRVVDPGNPETSSKIAAGIINPVTGRRVVKSWKIDQLLPFAEQTYHELETEFGIEVFTKRNIVRALAAPEEENTWLARSGDPEYQRYMLPEADMATFEGKLKPTFSHGELKHGAQMKMGKLIAAFRKKLKKNEALLETEFDHSKLEMTEAGVVYNKKWPARKVIFCEGENMRENPFFSELPLPCSKGEMLFVRIPEAKFEKMYKQKIFIVPQGDDIYWVGSNYSFQFKNADPTEKGKQYLIDRLHSILDIPFEVVSHHAAIRPTVRDRRPLLGFHSEYPQLAIFNGLGTKGASLGPFWAAHMADFLQGEVELDREVDIRRFEKQ